jgi:hypothetical protein
MFASMKTRLNTFPLANLPSVSDINAVSWLIVMVED